MKKNLYAALLLLCFVMLVLPQKNVFAAASAPSPWAEESIKLANDAGLIPTDLNDDYQANITRREFCHVIMRFVHKSWEPVPEFPIDMKSPFSDVDDRLVNIAYELKITSGTGENKFNPDGFITRQEAAAMLYNAAKDYYGGKSYSPVTFADSAQIASWAKDKVQAVAGSGVLQGTSQTEFNPLGTYTREQCYVSVLRLHNLYVDSVKTANAETEYNSLTNANIRQLEEYIEKYPDSSFAKSAASRAEKLKNDLAPYNAVILKGLTDKNVETFIKDYPGHIKT
ncbi:S-layer homology domain-containing protein, partial [Tyzzerella sp. OttesenSCG-928-J15]|nr:S-layer homology domain-containing protein [Tyzzerella sp. OttesenSCG-928-J15]